LRLRRVRVAAGGVDAHDRDDIAGTRLIDLFAVFGVHAKDAAEPLLATGPLVVIHLALLDRSLINAGERQLAVGIVDDLERHADERLLGIGSEQDFLFRVLDRHRLGLALQRRREIPGDCVEQRLDALVLVGTAEEDRREVLTLNGGLHDAVDQVLRDSFFREQQFHQLIGVHRERLEHVMAGLFGCVLQVGGDFTLADRFALFSLEVERLHCDQVDHALELFAHANRNLQQHGVVVELFFDLADDLVGIGAGAVHLVDERQTRHVISLHLAVDGNRLRLDTAHRAKHQDSAVEHAEAAFHFDGEVDVARGVDQVYGVILPGNARGRAGDGDSPLPLQVHVIHRGTALAATNFLDAVDPPCVEEDSLAEGRFPRVDVGRYSDVANFGKIHSRGLPGREIRVEVVRSG